MVASSLIAILASLLFIGLFRRLAVKVELVDRPGGRKQHAREVPLIGGLAIFFGFCFALLFLPISLQSYRGMIAGGSLLLTIGVLDDFRELNSKLRLLIQMIAGLLLCWSGLKVSNLGDLIFIGDITLGILAIPFTIFLVVGFLNAMNMIDGQDGLAGGVALGQCLILSAISWQANRLIDFSLLFVLSLLLIVFLLFNMRLPWRKQASIFLGDAGSTFIAYIIAWFAISLGESGGTLQPVIILWVLALPVFDLFQVCLIRKLKNKPLFAPSLDHLHHLLHFAGWNVVLSTWVLIGFSFLLGVIGIVFNHFQIPAAWQLIVWLLILAGYLAMIKVIRNRIAHVASQ